MRSRSPPPYRVNKGYVGVRQNGILTPLDMNAGAIGCNSSCQPLNVKFGRTAETIVAEPLGNAHYDALQAHIAKRMGNGYSFASSYTWSKNISQSTGTIAGGQPSPTYALPQYAYLYKLTRRIRRSSLTSASTPNFRSAKASRCSVTTDWLRRFWAAGWLPASTRSTPEAASVSPVFTLNAVDGPVQRANVVPGVTQILGGLGPGNNYLNPAAFVAGPANQIGTAGPDILTGPTAFNLDASLARVFKPRSATPSRCELRPSMCRTHRIGAIREGTSRTEPLRPDHGHS